VKQGFPKTSVFGKAAGWTKNTFKNFTARAEWPGKKAHEGRRWEGNFDFERGKPGGG
jgi:hypothetical protein